MLRAVSEEKNNVVHATIRIYVNVIGDPMANPALAGRRAWWTSDLCAPLLPNGRQWIPLRIFFSSLSKDCKTANFSSTTLSFYTQSLKCN
jgi:hypothetical protein